MMIGFWALHRAKRLIQGRIDHPPQDPAFGPMQRRLT